MKNWSWIVVISLIAFVTLLGPNSEREEDLPWLVFHETEMYQDRA